MKLEWRTNEDWWASVMYIGTGALGMWIARDYPFGSALRMGPGYFPSVLGGIMVVMGVYVIAWGLRKDHEKIIGNWSIRALIVLPLSMIAFGILMEEAGFIPAMAALIPISAAAGRGLQVGGGRGAYHRPHHRVLVWVHLPPGLAVSSDQGHVGLLIWTYSTTSSSVSPSRCRCRTCGSAS